MFASLKKLFFNRKASEKNRGHFCNAINLGDIEGQEWIRIVPIGDFPRHPDGAHRIEPRHIEQMVKNKQASGTDLLVDVDHLSFFGMRTEAAAWIAASDLEARADGLYAKYPVFTTDEMREKVNKRVYRYLSPVYALQDLDKSGVDIGATIDSLALTNRPYMDREIDHLKNSTTESPMSEVLKKVLSFFGLPENATEQQVDEKLNSFKSAIGFEGDMTLEVAVQKIGEIKNAKPVAQQNPPAEPKDDPVAALNARIDAMEQKANSSQAEQLIAAAIADGKIAPTDKDIWLNAARANFDDTKKKIDARQKNSAMPGKVDTPGDQKPEKVNSIQAAADYFKSQGRAPVAKVA